MAPFYAEKIDNALSLRHMRAQIKTILYFLLWIHRFFLCSSNNSFSSTKNTTFSPFTIFCFLHFFWQFFIKTNTCEKVFLFLAEIRKNSAILIRKNRRNSLKDGVIFFQLFLRFSLLPKLSPSISPSQII